MFNLLLLNVCLNICFLKEMLLFEIKNFFLRKLLLKSKERFIKYGLLNEIFIYSLLKYFVFIMF